MQLEYQQTNKTDSLLVKQLEVQEFTYNITDNSKELRHWKIPSLHRRQLSHVSLGDNTAMHIGGTVVGFS